MTDREMKISGYFVAGLCFFGIIVSIFMARADTSHAWMYALEGITCWILGAYIFALAVRIKIL